MAKPKHMRVASSPSQERTILDSKAASANANSKSNKKANNPVTIQEEVASSLDVVKLTTLIRPYFTFRTLLTIALFSILLFLLVFIGEMILSFMLKTLFELVLNGPVISLDHAISKLDEPVLLHSAVLLFQLVLVSLLSFMTAWICSNSLLGSLQTNESSVYRTVLSGGSRIPTFFLLGSMVLFRLACYFFKFSPSHTLLMLHWSFPFSKRIYDLAYYSLITLSIYASVSVTHSLKRIELLEEDRAAHAQLEAKKKWELQQQALAAQAKAKAEQEANLKSQSATMTTQRPTPATSSAIPTNPQSGTSVKKLTTPEDATIAATSAAANSDLTSTEVTPKSPPTSSPKSPHSNQKRPKK